MSKPRHRDPGLSVLGKKAFFDSPPVQGGAGMARVTDLFRSLSGEAVRALPDRRGGPRYATPEGTVVVAWEAAPGVSTLIRGSVENVSEGGARVRLDGLLTLRGSLVYVQLKTPSGCETAQAGVLGSFEQGAVRLRFVGGCPEGFFTPPVRRRGGAAGGRLTRVPGFPWDGQQRGRESHRPPRVGFQGHHRNPLEGDRPGVPGRTARASDRARRWCRPSVRPAPSEGRRRGTPPRHPGPPAVRRSGRRGGP